MALTISNLQYLDNGGNTNAVLAEASNATDLSAITVRVKVEGV